MTVKTAQARIKLANIIESLLGYSVTKVSNTTAADEQIYNTQGKSKSLYRINSEHSVLARAQKTRSTANKTTTKYRDYFSLSNGILS